ncbi:YkgJ family cysteine cluster protein [Fimbriiglobus ruber]|uniref:DUF3109 family protein n=1 Tax=Fimbriiglobus ruber TaxID=1908690 RepID=A0A225DHJ8_9BACT|nr:DUF3109 family protein [Fimbriiglobus ruber]OWK39154.1 hypothetical protein FRUB_06236 [Fimbriiglobus ruber]
MPPRKSPAKTVPLTVTNGDTATFDCTFGRGCPGLCCQNGRPSLSEAEQKVVTKNLKKFVPHLRPEAAKLIEAEGFLSGRTKLDMPMLRVIGGWCVFFNEGCVFHKVGLAEGDFAKYKPSQCVIFPLEPNGDGTYYVRQWGLNGEKWDLFCLNPAETDRKAVDTMGPELEYASRLPVAGAGG